MKKILVSMIIVCLILSSIGIVSAISVGDNLEGVIPFIKRQMFPVSYEQRRAEISLAELGGLGEDANTTIYEVWIVDSSFTVIESFTADEGFGYVDEGEILNYIIVNVNVSKAYVDNGTQAENNTRVFLSFGKTGVDPITEGYMHSVGAGVEDDYYTVMYQAYIPHVFEAGMYYVYTEFDVRY